MEERTPEGSLHRVFRLRGLGGEAFLKHFQGQRKWKQARDAYRGPLRDLDGVPRLLGVHDEPPALLCSVLPGADVEGPGTIEQHAAAGRWLRALHDRPHPQSDPMPLHEALARRLDTWLRRGRKELGAARRERARERFGGAEAFRGEPRVFCHRDFRPRNWRWDEGRLSVLDFEHAGGGPWLEDLVRLHAGPWRERPELKGAFLAAYGRRVEEEDRERWELLLLLFGLASLVWGLRFRDERWSEEGRQVLEELGI